MAGPTKSSKAGRNKTFCEAYRRAEKRTISHLKRAWKHVRRYGTTDHMAVHYLNNASVILKRKVGVPDSIIPTKTSHKRIAPVRPMKDNIHDNL
ncbi:MAG: hypothetical protein KGJ90_00185 [Patescibacteria group bacterium]|nr:hypothetical protein [Patescibacteria group bacterium]